MTQREREILMRIQENPMIGQQELAQELNITRSSVAVHISNLIKKGYIAGKGYVLREGNYCVVVGGVNVDIGGRSHQKLVAEDSNPGTVSMSMGGVGRNIAHNMTLLGIPTRMLTAVGEDPNGQRVLTSCGELGIDMGRALRVREEATSTYLYIADPEGEMALAISDMEICKRIDPGYLAANLAALQNAQVVVADTNIPQESLLYLAENLTVPLFCDPVSTQKARKLLPILHKIHTLKPNRLEAELLSGVTIRDLEDAKKAARVLLEKGVSRVILSMGAQGILAVDAQEEFWTPNLPGTMVNTTGCGDAATAALVWAHLQDWSLKNMALACAAAGAITMEAAETINPQLSGEAISARMGMK